MSELSKEYALGVVLSDDAGLDYDEVLDTLENDNNPYLIWEPFENNPPSQVAAIIEDFEAVFRQFEKEVLERETSITQ